MTEGQSAQNPPWGRLFGARGVAVVGANPDPARYGGAIMSYLRELCDPATVYPVNPRYTSVMGLPCYPSVLEVPDPIDTAILLINATRVSENLALCAERGVAFAVVPGALNDRPESEQRAWESELVASARATGTRVVGPNCIGIISPSTGVVLSNSTVLRDGLPPKGPIALVSQSGGILGAVASLGRDYYGAGFSHLISMGNGADLGLVDFVEFLAEDPDTTVICAFAEGLRDVPRFLRAAARARENGKTILLLKGGRSEIGARAAASHSGALTGAHALHETVMSNAGVIQVRTLEEMLAGAVALVRYPSGAAPGLAMVTRSGGACSYVADRAQEMGVALAPLELETRRGLHAIIGKAVPTNPVDLAAGGSTGSQGPGEVRRALDLLAPDPTVGVRVMADSVLLPMNDLARQTAASALQHDKPLLVGWLLGRLADEPVAILREAGVPVLRRVDDMLAAVRILVERGAMASRQGTRGAEAHPDSTRVGAALRDGLGRWTELEALKALEAYGIPVVETAPCPDAEAAALAAERLGYPVAVKVHSPDLGHKSDVGGVRLDLRDPAAVALAAREVVAAARRAQPEARIEGVLVQRMADAGTEVFFGAEVDPEYGPVVSVGLGGVLVEVLRDVSRRVAPVGPEEARDMLRELRGWPLLAGVRGRSGVDLEGLAGGLAAFSRMVSDQRDLLRSADVNPIIAGPSGIRAVDALFVPHPQMGAGQN